MTKIGWATKIDACIEKNLAIEGGDTEGGGGFADDGATYPGCDIDIDHECFNQPGRQLAVDYRW